MADKKKPEPRATVIGNADDMEAVANTLERIGDAATRTAEELEATQEIQVNTMNEFGLGKQMDLIRPIAFPQFTTKQQAFRFAAWLVFMAETLPDESMDHTFLEIAEAIKNT